MQNAPTFFARGVLIDVAGLKGVEMLGDTYEITVADLQQALQRENLKLLPGDAVIIHTGWGKLYGKDNARFVKSTPGITSRARTPRSSTCRSRSVRSRALPRRARRDSPRTGLTGSRPAPPSSRLRRRA